MAVHVNQLATAKDLIWAWTGRTIRGRYQQSVLGWLWAVVQPAASVAIFTFIFTQLIPIDTGVIPYVVFSYAAIAPWTFFSTAVIDMAESLVQNMILVTKIYFPREALPIAAMMARLMDFGIAATLLVVIMIYYQIPPFPVGWLFLPVILGIQLMLIMGLGLGLAALNIFYRDVKPLLTLTMQLWFYASPIIYPVTLVPEYLQSYYYLNPMVGIIQSYRDVLLIGQLPGSYLGISAVVSFVILLIGYGFFKKVEFQFADIV